MNNKVFMTYRTADMTEVARRVCSASPKVAYIVDAGKLIHCKNNIVRNSEVTFM